MGLAMHAAFALALLRADAPPSADGSTVRASWLADLDPARVQPGRLAFWRRDLRLRPAGVCYPVVAARPRTTGRGDCASHSNTLGSRRRGLLSPRGARTTRRPHVAVQRRDSVLSWCESRAPHWCD